MKVEMEQLLPEFLRQDRNGAALGAAIEKGLNLFLEAIQAGLELTLDPEKMPEWRLDEMAWELGCLYDYRAELPQKRRIIRDAVPLYAVFGTPDAIYKYLGSYFDRVEVEENWLYGGEDFHFRVSITGGVDARKLTWVREAVEKTKNVRSVFDGAAAAGEAGIVIGAEAAVTKFPYLLSGQVLCGTYPGTLI